MISDVPVETEVPPNNVFNRFFEVLDKDVQMPFFAWIHVLPPHTPYLPPVPFRGMFGSNIVQLNKGDAERALYDEFIRYCDDEFRKFIQQAAGRAKLKNTVIIVSSDHGESFEHDYHGHGGLFMYEDVTHVPLIIKLPGQTEGKTISDLVGHINIPSTILDLAGITEPQWMEGRSLMSLMQGNEYSSHPIFSMNFETNPTPGREIRNGIIAVWEDDYKLIHNIVENKSECFNLKSDPQEQYDLFEKETLLCRKMLGYIQHSLTDANRDVLH
jgi:arylsulfatase A-like enzyme